MAGLCSLRTFAGCLIFFCLFFFFSYQPGYATDFFYEDAQLIFVPERSLAIIGDNKINAPAWMRSWQAARALARDKNLKEAATIYSKLLRQKPELEIVRWEYSQLLAILGNNQAAAENIAALRLLAPDNVSYQLFSGRMALRNGSIEKAIQDFGEVLETIPSGSEAVVAMKGLAEALRRKDKTEYSFALEEQQLLGQGRGNTDSQLLATKFSRENASRLLDDALRLESTSKLLKIIKYLPSLTSFKDEQLRTTLAHLLETEDIPLSLLTRVFDEILRRFPDDNDIRQKFIDVLMKKSQYHKALKQYDQILSSLETPSVLLSAASLAMGAANSPDKALDYYRRYQKLYPEDSEVQGKIESLHILLAKDFLAIVENGAIGTLWLDMGQLQDDRQLIFLQMVKLLKMRENQADLTLAVEILKFLRQHGVNSTEVKLSLVDIYLLQKDLSAAMAILYTIPHAYRGDHYYETIADISLQQGNEFEAIEAFSELLQMHPDREDIRQQGIVLCGALGLVEKAKQFFTYYTEPQIFAEALKTGSKKQREEGAEITLQIKKPLLETLFLYIYFLAENRQFDSLQEVMSWAATMWQDEPDSLVRIRLEEADALRRAKRFYAADQFLREQLNKKRLHDAVLLALAQNAADRGREEEMEQWLAILDSQLFSDAKAYSTKTADAMRMLIKARLFLRRQKPEDAAELLLAMDNSFWDSQQGTPIQRGIAELCELGEEVHAKTLRQFCRMRGEYPLIAWGNAPKGADLVQHQQWNRSSSLLFKGKQDLLQKSYNDVAKNLTKFYKDSPSSLLGGLLLADAAAGMKDYARSYEILQNLGGDLGVSCWEEIRHAGNAGNFELALTRFYRCYGDIDRGENPKLAANLFSGGQPREAMLLARLLWRAGNFEKALSVYRQILSVPVADEIVTHYRQRLRSDFPGVSKERTFWDFFRILKFSKEEKLETLDALLSPQLLAQNIDNSAGLMLAGNSLFLSIQKTLLQEYDARKAIFERKFYYAEKSYRSLLKEESSQGVMTDLAAIYERMGMYQKQAQLYKEMEKSGPLNPVLEKNKKENLQKITPLILTDFSVMKKKSWQRYQDSKKRDFGLSLNYLLDLDLTFDFYYEKQNFSSYFNPKSVGLSQIGVDSNWQFGRNIEFSAGFGVEKKDDSSRINLLYHIGAESQLDELVTGCIEFIRTKIDDSVTSVDKMLFTDTLSTGLSIETPVGVSFGGKLHYLMHSDNNNGKELFGFVTYSLFMEGSELTLSYNTRYCDNDNSNPVRKNGMVKEIAGGRPDSYWSPKNYYSHKIASRYQYEFNAFAAKQNVIKKRATGILQDSFVAIELATGIENQEEYFYSADFDISLEISQHCLLRSSLGFLQGKNREEMSFFTAVQYRW